MYDRRQKKESKWYMSNQNNKRHDLFDKETP